MTLPLLSHEVLQFDFAFSLVLSVGSVLSVLRVFI